MAKLRKAKVKKDRIKKLGKKTLIEARGLKIGKKFEIDFLLRYNDEGYINSIIKKAYIKYYGYTHKDFHGKIQKGVLIG